MAHLRSYRFAVVLGTCTLAVVFTACGSRGVQVAENSSYHRGAEIFSERCSGCHTLEAAGAEGSGSSKKSVGPKTSGPDLDRRKESVDSALYAIRNGGFSGAIMPQNIAVGNDALEVARFVAKYAGEKDDSSGPPGPRGSSGRNSGTTNQSSQ